MLAVLALALPAAAQEEEGDPVAGRELATQLCTACHIVGSENVGSDVAPPFAVIARDPDVTLTELHAWIGPRHPVLPNLALTPEQIADINAYLDSLHEAPAEAEPPGSRPRSRRRRSRSRRPKNSASRSSGPMTHPAPAVEWSSPAAAGPPSPKIEGREQQVLPQVCQSRTL